MRTRRPTTTRRSWHYETERSREQISTTQSWTTRTRCVYGARTCNCKLLLMWRAMAGTGEAVDEGP